MVKRQTYISMILLLILVFATGIIVGRSVSNPELSEVNKFIKQSELATESYLIEQELFAGMEKNCDLAKLRLSALSRELWQLGKLLGSETAKEDLGMANYDFLKRKFHLMQIKTYTLYHRLSQDCAVDVPVILFYYSQNDSKSLEQGAILDKLVSGFDVTVFAIEYNYSPELRFLEDYYEISTTPSIVVNFDIVRKGLTPYEELVALVREE
ncbi:MAG: hypothetical protein QXT19_02020 [Candidatus Woesearchaeota archaeon]